MNPLIKWLLVLLGLQLLLAGWAFWPRPQAGLEAARTTLLEIDASKVSRAQVSGEGGEVTLVRAGDGWQLPDYHELPADAARARRALDELPELPRGYPVATTGSARERFETAADNFQRRVEYFADEDSLGSIYIGSSPGYRKVHASFDDGESVYSIAFNSFDLPLEQSAWLDKTLLQVAAVDVVTGRDYTLRRHGETQWQDAEGETADELASGELISGLGNLRVNSAADEATAEVLAESSATASLEVQAGGQRFEYSLYEIEDAHYLKRDDMPAYFGISKYDYDRLNDPSRASLFPPPAAEDDAADAPEEPGEAPAP